LAENFAIFNLLSKNHPYFDDNPNLFFVNKKIEITGLFYI